MTTTKRRRRGRTLLTLDALSLPALLSLSVGWQPPRLPFDVGRGGPWATWAEFDADYAAVREEFLESTWAELPGGELPFAERRYQEARSWPT
jgi:hypothetical protein